MSVEPSVYERAAELSANRTMRVLVCGGRDFWDRDVVYQVMGKLHAAKPIGLLIHGNARGADALGKIWAVREGVSHHPCPAQWSKHGKRAGPIRNQNMLGLSPDLVVAFPGGAGTRDMVKRAKAAGVRVMEITPMGA